MCSTFTPLSRASDIRFLALCGCVQLLWENVYPIPPGCYRGDVDDT